MQGDTIVFFPKWTSLISEFEYYSDPYDVTGYNQINVEGFLGDITTAGTVSFRLQESNDLETWTNVTGASASAAFTAGAVAAISGSNTARYIRVLIHTWSAADITATLWVKGVARNT